MTEGNRCGLGTRTVGFGAALCLSAALACGPPAGEREAGAGPGVPAQAPLSLTYGPWVVDPVPALPRGEPGAWDSGLVDPGAMIVHMGRHHMLYNGIPEWPHPLSVGWAWSDDGVQWHRGSERPVFAPEPVPFGGWTIRATSVVVEDGA